MTALAALLQLTVGMIIYKKYEKIIKGSVSQDGDDLCCVQPTAEIISAEGNTPRIQGFKISKKSSRCATHCGDDLRDVQHIAEMISGHTEMISSV